MPPNSRWCGSSSSLVRISVVGATWRLRLLRVRLLRVTDAGVRLDSAWLANLAAPWEARLPDGEAPIAVAGFFAPDVEGVFQTAMAATVCRSQTKSTHSVFYPAAVQLHLPDDLEGRGGYPEWLDYCEDLLFDFEVNALARRRRLHLSGHPTPGLLSPAQSVTSFWTQYYRYARGDGKADLWRKRHALRYAIYLLILPALLGHGFFGFFAKWLGWAGLIVGGVAYCYRPWQRLRRLGQQMSMPERLVAVAWDTVLRVVGDVAKMVGYPVGWWWRMRRRAVRSPIVRRGTQ